MVYVIVDIKEVFRMSTITNLEDWNNVVKQINDYIKETEDDEKKDDIDKGILIGLNMALDTINENLGIKPEKEKKPMTFEEAAKVQRWLHANTFLFSSDDNNIKLSTDMAIRSFKLWKYLVGRINDISVVVEGIDMVGVNNVNHLIIECIKEIQGV